MRTGARWHVCQARAGQGVQRWLPAPQEARVPGYSANYKEVRWEICVFSFCLLKVFASFWRGGKGVWGHRGPFWLWLKIDGFRSVDLAANHSLPTKSFFFYQKDTHDAAHMFLRSMRIWGVGFNGWGVVLIKLEL